MTTAATIWAVAAIGMVVGAGYGTAGIALSLAVLLTLICVSQLETRYLGPCLHRKLRLTYEDAGGKAAIKIGDILDAYRIEPAGRRFECNEDGTTKLTLTYCDAHKHHKEFLVTLADLPEVLTMECQDPWKDTGKDAPL